MLLPAPLKLHDSAKWHKDAAIAARMAEQSASSGSVADLCVAAIAKQLEEERQRNRSILLKLLRSIYFLAKNRIPLMTTFEGLVKLQIANGDEILKHHVEQRPNPQYTSKISSQSLLTAIDSWIDSKLMATLQSSPFFSIMADECEDISTQEELSIGGKWSCRRAFLGNVAY